MSENNLKVAIISAGLGGLAMAMREVYAACGIALDPNINDQVYQKAHQLRPVGAGLSLFPTV